MPIINNLFHNNNQNLQAINNLNMQIILIIIIIILMDQDVVFQEAIEKFVLEIVQKIMDYVLYLLLLQD